MKSKLKTTIKHCYGRINAWLRDVKIGKNVYIGKRFYHNTREAGEVILGNEIELSHDATFLTLLPNCQIILHNNIRIAHHFQINCARHVEIMSNVNIAPYVFISDHNHQYEDVTRPIKGQGIEMKPDAKVIIDEGTWIGTKATIIGKVHVGKHCVIGANSVVTKDIPDYSVAAGIPAKVIKRYNFDTQQWEKVTH